MMSALTHLQEDFQDLLLGRASDMESRVLGTARVPIATRLAIYGDGYCLRLIEALQANYPALARLLDEHDFATLGRAYVQANESTFRSIRYYGAGLAQFLAMQPEYADAPVLSELARWEWAMTEVFDAADAEPIDVTALAQVEAHRWADLKFEFHPSVRMVELHWNVPQIWQALTDEAERPHAAVQQESTPWLLWRQDLKTYFRSLQPHEPQALTKSRAGGSFGEICAALALNVSEEETPLLAAGFLRQWVEAGCVVGVK